jgi:predicted MPP superfamily phosphohydrolase
VGLGVSCNSIYVFDLWNYVGRYNYKVINNAFFRITDAFDGFTLRKYQMFTVVVLIIREKISYAIDLVNEQNSDMILFTGDIVNTRRCILGLKRSIKLKKTQYGKYSVLGRTMIMENMSLTKRTFRL